ncbi:MAG: hypothetical protein HYV09_13330 [Deltaproteobacteria bacterium]|nr:hypothetical protein [Deltaproteobacteria bacterium]
MPRGRNPAIVTRVAAVIYAVASAFVIAFQLALAAGAPWGAFAMGGAFPGRLPAPMRVAAIVQSVLIASMIGVVLSRAGLALPRWSRAARWLVWVVVAVAAVGSVLNLITPSAGERARWAPIALALLASSTVVALGSRRAPPDGGAPAGDPWR